MDRASSLTFPGGRTLAGWWRQLAPLKPNGLWIGYAFLHRIEAPVYVQGEQPLEPLPHLVLQALALEESIASNHLPGIAASRIEERMQLPAAVLQRVLVDLLQHDLNARINHERWQTTERGRHAIARGAFSVRLRQRRVFPFVEFLDAAGQRLGEPQFMPIAECAGVAWPVDEAHRFDVGSLGAAIAQPADWKQAVGFPSDVERLAHNDGAEAWQQVLVDRPERVMLALATVDNHGRPELAGFAAKVDGWTLFDRTPILRLPVAATDAWPGLTNEIGMSVWQDVWRNWCRQRQLPANEVELCSLTWQPPRLVVQAPPRLVQRLQSAKSDVFKGEAWLLVGDGYVRTAVQLAMK